MLRGRQRVGVLGEQAPPGEPLLRHAEPGSARPLLGLAVADAVEADTEHREEREHEGENEPVNHEPAVALHDIGVEAEVH